MTDHARRRAGVPEALDVGAFLVANLESTDPDGPSMRCRTWTRKPVRSMIGRRVHVSIARGEA